MKMNFKERGTPERGIDRMQNEGGGGAALKDLLESHPDEETPRKTGNLQKDQNPEKNDRQDDRKKSS